MKIARLETIRTGERPSVIWVKVVTDDGLTGLGETWFGAAAVEADIHERIAPLILGREAADIAALTNRMKPYVGFCGTGTELRALSAIEVALWDLAGKASGRPLFQLLGGKQREGIALYNTCAGPGYVSQSSDVRPDNFGLPERDKRTAFEDLDAFLHRPEELAGELLESGISAMKIWPFDFSEGAKEGLQISDEDLTRALKPFEKIRAAHGEEMRLKAELHGLWSLPAAMKICRALEPLGVDWVEDPVWMDRFDDLGELARSTPLRLAGGETLGGLGQINDVIARGGIGVPIVDITWGGGIGFAQAAAHLARDAGLSIAFHDCSGPVTLAVSTHLALATPNVEEQEFTRAFFYGWYGEVVTGLPTIEKGMISLSDAPGHGLSLAPERLRQPDVTLRVSSEDGASRPLKQR